MAFLTYAVNILNAFGNLFSYELQFMNSLNWDRCIDNNANKISRTLGVMNKLKHFLPYSSLIAPHFNNNILLRGFNTHRLIKLQKRAIRIITDSKYNSHTEPLY